ncbi:hypothetical protein ID866_4535 [Astraeus odoratus]|nr:hypothetical protein ID866_4535 [Astraeus odoratus]
MPNGGCADEPLRLFLSRTRALQDPSAVYTFDSERGVPRSVLCREPSSDPQLRSGAMSSANDGQGSEASRRKECAVVSVPPTRFLSPFMA